MAAARKFGTFAGVFTPSILTILGVIMYLRLPMIVGQAGLWTTIGIIAVAHLISFTTGLSVASIATDKKVRGGGTYFMVSRSLGLPLGGTLGIALFVGLSFSVSLYVIGFAESFLGFWNLEITRNTIRLTGGIVLLAVLVVTFISTALALRMQFFIMAAIALSLLSIAFGRHEFAPASPNLDPLPGAAPFIVLFAIFFPAVTGFEAGVAMSGDLKDPKRSLPLGSLAAIGIGFAVYLLLAVFFAFTVAADQLATNNRVLFEISLFAPLVAAGIWGATVSSALGSILGAPRILQATSQDRITPAFFAKGHGRGNEPRRALLLAAAIAFSGVMIGELNVIARVVSMFFIATYGFLNLGCAIESWASPDFRPAFRIPRGVSVVGALACLIVMIQLDLIAMIGATIVLGSLYLILARRQLRLESGDAWEGFWSSVARAALHRLDRSEVHQRNWRPNVVLFAGQAGARPELVELGQHLAGERGLLSNVELVERATAAEVCRPASAVTGQAEPPYGVFVRRLECRDVYDGMEQIAGFYGFAGIEPNTILLGWGAKSREPQRFAALLRTLCELDHNVLALHRDPERGFGARARIDVWWRGAGNHVGLTLALLRFLTGSDDWRGTRVRFLTVLDDDTAAAAVVRRNLLQRLMDARFDAEVEVIRNTERRAFGDILRAESADADLTLLGLPPVPSGEDGRDYVRRTTLMLDGLGSVLLVHASSYFAGSVAALPVPIAAPAVQPPRERGFLSPLTAPAESELATPLLTLDAALQTTAAGIARQCIEPALQPLPGVISSLAGRATAALDDVVHLAASDRQRALRLCARAQGDWLHDAWLALIDLRERWLAEQAAAFAEAGERLLADVRSAAAACPERFTVVRPIDAFRAAPGDALRLRVFKATRRSHAVLGRRDVRYAVPLASLAHARVERAAVEAYDGVLRAAGRAISSASHDLLRLIGRTNDAFERCRRALDSTASPDDWTAGVAEDQTGIRDAAAEAVTRQADALDEASAVAARELRHAVETVRDDSSGVDAHERARHLRRSRGATERAALEVPARAAEWLEIESTGLAGVLTDARLVLLRHRLRAIVRRARRALRREIRNGIRAQVCTVRAALTEFLAAEARDANAELRRRFADWPTFDADAFLERLLADFRAASSALPESVAVPEAAFAAARAGADDAAVEVVTIALRRLVEYRLETRFLGPLQERLAALPPLLDDAIDAATDTVRLAAVRLPSADEFGADAAHGSTRAAAVRSSMPRIDTAIAALDAHIDALDDLMRQRTESAIDRLALIGLMRTATALHGYVRRQRGREALSRLHATWLRARGALSTAVVHALYERSEGVLLARRLGEQARHSTGTQIRRLVAGVSPRPGVLEALPFHYRQLFLGKPSFTRDYWVGWRDERARAAAIIAEHRRGQHGGLLVLGGEGSGKTSLLHALALEHFAADRVHVITPPPDGSADADVFLDRLRAAVNAAPDDPDPAALIRAGSVLVLDDLDRWWQRSSGGFAVLDVILALMERHAAHCFVLAAADIHAFRFIDRLRPIQGRFLDIIECAPLSARQIAEVVVFRHGSTGLTFRIGGEPEQRLSNWRRARLFNALFDFSDGNIGVALQGWITHVRAVADGRLDIDPPARPNLRPLDALTPVQVLLLVQILLHRGLSHERLEQLAPMPHDELAAELATLRRFGLLQESSNAVLHVNRYLRPHLVRRFVNDRVIA
jgi:amino acid transporter